LNRVTDRLSEIEPQLLTGLHRGIEKESLRCQPDGALALTPHPLALGSALAHQGITTDFSESQLELITGVHTSPAGCLEELTEIHQFVHRNIGEELLWAGSMPCGLPADELIPVGRYGSSNVGRAKTVYRMGLSHRYGCRMQTISGIHYNFSLPESAWAALQGAEQAAGSEQDYRSAAYFSLIRNFRRHSWLLLYLFGASPVICRSFLADRPHGLQALGSGTLYLPYATSLRMGPLGYQSDAQASLAVSFNCLASYSDSLGHALTDPYPAYERLGIRGDDGSYRQLATSLLQIENEFYGTIRPKRRIRPGERPLRALARAGVEYVEVRCLDLDPFSPIGVGIETTRFLDVFLLHCLLSDSPRDTPEEIAELSRNQHAVAQRGREPGMQLSRNGRPVELVRWGEALLKELVPIAAALDAADGNAAGTNAAGTNAAGTNAAGTNVAVATGAKGSGAAAREAQTPGAKAAGPYSVALASAAAALADPSRTPSARVLREMAEQYDNSFSAFALAQSMRHREVLLAMPFDPAAEARLLRLAEESLAEQRAIEAADTLPFEIYRQKYIAGTLLDDAA
jgi:glutamate--cysteine ligase